MRIIGDRVLIKPDYTKTETGIFLPPSRSEKSHRRYLGKVVSVPKNLRHEMVIDDTVMFDDYGETVELKTGTHIFLHPDYIIGVVE